MIKNTMNLIEDANQFEQREAAKAEAQKPVELLKKVTN